MINGSHLAYEVLLDITNVLNSQRNTNSFWRAVTEQITRVIPWERAGITLYDPVIGGFTFYALETNVATRILRRDTIIQHAGSAVGWVFDHHQIHVRPNLTKERMFLEDDSYAQEGLERMINIPLLVRDTCLGTLNIGGVQPGDPDPGDLRFLQQVATQVAYAIDNIRAYEQIDRLREQLVRENEGLVEEVKGSHNAGTMVGISPAFRRVVDLVQTVAPIDATVLITGETGTGKELLARAIHELSTRKHRPFIRVNCAALPIGLVESELFGHERGAFTGANHRRIGRFELAHGGTLFLDEIAEMPVDMQAKLLRVLQDGLVDRVGGSRPVAVDVRLIAATNADLAAAVTQGRFRSDLYYRLNVFPIHIPPLRERPEDIPLLARHFLDLYRAKFKRHCAQIDSDSLHRLIRYQWPGNVRELENVIERVMILCRGDFLHIDQALVTPLHSTGSASPVERLEECERRHILQTLAATNWRIEGHEGAAQRLGLPPSTLRSRIKKLGLQRPADLVLT